MRSRLKQAARLALKGAAAAVDPLFGRYPGPRILIYHQVGVDLGREMEVSIGAFAEQLEWMRDHGQIVDLETALERRGDPDAHRLFVLTFDDGFEDLFLNAFPLMHENGIPFTLYIASRPVESGEPLDPRYPDARPLTWDQITEMIATGLVTTGAHTHTHIDLRRATTDQVSEEVGTSNELILERTGVRPQHFTYPWGWWSEQAHDIVSNEYVTASLGSGRAVSPSTDVHLLNRIPIQRADATRLAVAKLRYGGRTENQLRRLRRGYWGP